MLSRRHLRIKVLQALYAFFQSGDTQLEIAEKQLIRSFDKLYELYVYHLSFIVEVIDFASGMMESAMKKYFPTEEERNPNRRFVDNRFIAQLRENKDFKKQHNRYKISWGEETELIRRTWQNFRNSEEYRKYMSDPEGGYEADKNIIKAFVRQIILPSESLQSFYEEKSIHWVDDYDVALMMVIKTIKHFSEDDTPSAALPPMIKEEDGDDEFREFILPLFNKTVLNSKEYEGLIAANAEHWDLDRIASLDVIILKMALCEMMNFNSIPVKVTINEYIEIAKEYSTPKSRIFVNGMLDKLLIKLRSDSRINKTGRGLME